MKQRILLLAAISISSQLQAQTDTSYHAGEEVVVTANKFPQKQSQTGKVVAVINSATLLQNQGRTLSAVLNNQAGVMIMGAENAPGTNLAIFTRGASSQYTAILINGIPVTDPSGVYSYLDLNTLPIEQVERVEILKGGQSTLYGTDASAGVINIIMKKSTVGKVAGSGHLAAGSFNTVKANAAVTGNSGGFQYAVNFAHQQSKGFSAARDVAGGNNFDRDGFTQNALSTTLGYTKNNYSISAFVNYGKYRADLDDAAFRDDRDYEFTNRNLVAGVQSQLNFNKGAWITQYSYQRHERLNFNDKGHVAPGSFTSFYRGEFEGRNQVAESYVRLKPMPNLQLVAGADYRAANYGRVNDFGFGPDVLARDTVKNSMYAVYVSGAYQPNKALNIEAGVRYNQHSEYGNNLSWNVNPSIGVNDQVRVFANLSTAFRAPSLDELFAPSYGNPGLGAETSMSWDAGFSFGSPNRKFNIRMAAFARRVKNVIVYRVTNPVTFDGKYFNANEQQEEGVEAELRYMPAAQWTITANYTSVQGRGKDGAKLVENLYRRPRHLLNAQLQYTPNAKWLISTAFKAVGKRTDAGFPDPIALGSYYTADCYLQYQLRKNVKIYTDFRNITDQVYFDINGYNNRRFNVMAGVLVSL